MKQIDYLGKTGSNWIKSDKICSSWITSSWLQLVQNVSNLFKLDQIGSIWIKLDQDKSDGSAKI